MVEASPSIAASRRSRARSGPDRVVVGLMTLTAFLIVLAVLATELRAASVHVAAHRVVLVRRIYRTTIVETAPGGSGAAGNSVTQSVSSSGASASVSAAPTTRTS